MQQFTYQIVKRGADLEEQIDWSDATTYTIEADHEGAGGAQAAQQHFETLTDEEKAQDVHLWWREMSNPVVSCLWSHYPD